MAAQPAYAKNPSLDKEGLPKDKGETRDVDGQLQYLNPMTDQWESAVRLRDIRQRVLQGNGQTYTIPKKHGNAHGQEPLNYTSFLPGDQSYGPLRANRNPILFQLKPIDFGVEPTGYIQDHDDIVLDAFDHGIRDFGDAMPLCLSTEIEGHDIETYKRRNMKIALYDIIARMPGSYWTGRLGQTWRDKPPRAGSVSMRATRFRLRAGCLTWNEKGDSDAKNSAMMTLMPPAVRTVCENNNSTRSFRDLSRSEQTRCETATGNRPAKASKANRAKKQAEIEEDSTDDGDMDQEDDADADEEEEGGYEEAPRLATRPIAKPTSRKGLSQGHTNAKKRTPPGDSASGSRHLQSNKGHKRFKYETSSEEDVGKAPRKLRRTNKGQDPQESGSEYEPAFVKRPAIRSTLRNARTHIQSSRADAESALAFEEAIAYAMGVPKSTFDDEDKHASEDLYDSEEQYAEFDPQPWDSVELIPGTIFDVENVDKKGVVLNVDLGARRPRRHSNSDGATSDQAGNQALKSNTIPGEETQDAGADEDADVLAASRKMSKRARRSTARKEPRNTRLADNMKSATRDDSSIEVIDTATADRRKLKGSMRHAAQKTAPYANNEQLSLPDALAPFADNSQALSFHDFGGDVPYTSLDQILPPAPLATFSDTAQITQEFDLGDAASYVNFQLPLTAIPTDAHPLSDGFDPHTMTYAANAPQTVQHGQGLEFIEGVNFNFEDSSSASLHGVSEVDFDPTCEGFQSEVATGVEAGDYRYVSPRCPEDIETVDRVLELSRADFYQKTGHRVPKYFVHGYKGENYASQQRRLDALFENDRIEAKNYDGESIYSLPEWLGGFNDPGWRNALDEEGTRLEDVTQDYDF